MARRYAAMTAELPIQVERGAEQPLHSQIRDQLRAAILRGQVAAGGRMPSTRELAAALCVSRNVVVAVYDTLYAEGYIEGRHGSGTYVAGDLFISVPSQPLAAESPRWLRAEPWPQAQQQPDPPGSMVFRLGRPASLMLPAAIWRTVWRDVGARTPPNTYGPPAGDPALRAAIAGYLGRMRGVICGAEDVVVTSGATQALDLIGRATLGPGDPAAIEEPGYPVAQHILRLLAAPLLPAPVDDDGLQVERLPRGEAAPKLVYVTPSHQYPLGVRLSAARRLALLDWARANGSLIVEDDYDSEFRFDAPPLPALASMDPRDCVTYIGTFSKVLSPSLRLGYLVAPPALRRQIEWLKCLSDFHTPWPVQQAVAALMTAGHLDRYIRRMRRLYARRRSVLREALTPVAGLARLHGLEAGLHAYLELRDDLDPREIADEARARDVVVDTLDTHYLGLPDRRGLLLGYGGLDEADINRGATVLARVIGGAARRRAGS